MKAPNQGGASAPIRWDLVEEHLDEAAFLHAQWERALLDPEYVLADVAEGPEERMLAHLDGLVVAGRRAAEKVLLPALAGDDPDVVFAAAWGLLASEDGDFTRPVLDALTKAEPEPAAAIGRALQLAPLADAALLRPLVSGGAPAAQAAAVEALAHRRLDPGIRLDPLQASEHPAVRRAALRLASRFPARAHPQLLERALASADPAERDLAIATGLVLGVHEAWPACAKVVRDGGPAWDFPALVHALSGETDLAPLLGALGDPARRRAALFALGFTGRIAAADAVLPFLADEKDGKVAGEAFSAVTGLVLEGKLARPPKPWRPGAARDDEAEPEREDDLPAPDPAEVERWWSEAREKLDPGTRLAGGIPWSGNTLLDALERGPMRRRESLALELAVRSRGALQLEARGLARRQLEEIAGARASPPRVLAGPWAEVARAPVAGPAAPRPPAPPAAPRPTPRDALAVTGLGMATSIADGAVQSCAAARAGIVRVTAIAEAPVWDEDDAEVKPATAHVAPHTSGHEGVARLAVLAAVALEDLLPALAADPQARTGLFLALPSGYFVTQAEAFVPEQEPEEGAEPASPPPPPPDPGRAAFLRRDAEARLVAAMHEQVPDAPGFAVQRLFFAGGAGLVEALAAAREALRAGTVERCVVGGVDSLAAPEVLSALATLGLLKGPEVPTGIAPGEAAALLLVEPPERARRARRPALGYVLGAELRREGVHALAEAPFTGRALAEALSAAVGSGAPPALLVGDLDGTTVRAQDWGSALQRTKAVQGAPEWYPAIHFGALGAAAGPVAIALACRGFARGYAPPDVLVWLWGEEGGRGAIRLAAP